MLATLVIGLALACDPAVTPGAGPPAPGAAPAVAPPQITVYPGTYQGAEQLVRALMKPGGDLTITQTLQPRPEDYAAVFEAPVAEAIRSGSQAAWASVQAIGAMDGQTELRLNAATSDELRAGSEVFPDYGPVLGSLRPGFTWYRFKFVRPGESAGTQYDGLVYVKDHWALFPAPWRHLPPRPSPEECAKFAENFVRLMSAGQEGETAEITRQVAEGMRPDLLKDCKERGMRPEVLCVNAATSMAEIQKCDSNSGSH